MRIRPFATFAATFAFLSFVSFASAAPAVQADEARNARAWLTRINEAASTKNFVGTFVVSSRGRVASSKIAHFVDGGEQLERIEALDGQMRQVLRRNSEVTTLWPQSGVAVVEQRDLLSSFPALLQAGGERIVDFYDVATAGTDRVAGYEADVLQVRPRDALRYGYRLWAEKHSGLLLRAEVLDDQDQVLESSAFSEVSIGVKPQPQSVHAALRHLDRYRIARPTMTPVKLEAQGWTLRRPVPGFKQISSVRRAVSAPLDSTRHGQEVLQAIFSDGLTYVSVFVEPFNPERHSQAMQTSLGATRTLMHRQGDWWVTVMGDVPASTLRQFADGLERVN